MGHQMLQVMAKGLTLGQGLPCTDPKGEGHITEMGFGIERSGKGQDVCGFGLLAKPKIEVKNLLIIGQQDHDLAIKISMGQGHLCSCTAKGLYVGQGLEPGLILDFDINVVQAGRPRLAASAS